MKVEFLVSIKHPDDAEPMFLTEEQAKELYDALHAEFGDFDQARELSQLARESVARELRIAQLEATVKAYRSGPLSYGPGREAFEKYLEGGCSENGRVMRHEGMTLGPTCADPFPETGPSLQDDIEAMIAKSGTHTVDDADEQEAEFLSRLPKLKHSLETVDCAHCGSALDDTSAGVLCASCAPSNTPEPPAEPEKAPEPTAPSNEHQVKRGGRRKADRSDPVAYVVDHWNRLRTDYPWDTHSRTITRIGWTFGSAEVRPTSKQIREWLRIGGVNVEDAPSKQELANHARAVLVVPKPPLGYRVVDAEAWKASASMISESEIRELAEGGLERIGLAVAA